MRHGVPGFAGIRAVSRFAILGELALAVFAAVGIDRVLARVAPRWRTVVVGGLAVLVLLECAIGIQFVRVPTSRDDGGIDTALRRIPHGVVLELPIVGSSSGGPAWAYVETPRQLVALHDGDPRVNGYSGFEPAGFNKRGVVLNHFPKPGAARVAVLSAFATSCCAPSSSARSRPRSTGPLERRRRRPLLAGHRAQHGARAPTGRSDAVQQLPGGYLIQLR